MQKCWSANAQDRPTISEVVKTLSEWHDYGKNKDYFVIAESKRIERVLAKGLNPDSIGRMYSFKNSIYNVFNTQITEMNIHDFSNIFIQDESSFFSEN